MAPGTEPLAFLIDADVILDVLARREPFAVDSAAVLAACETGRCRGLIAAHTVTTIAYLLRKYCPPTEVRTRLTDLMRIVQVAAVNQPVIERALSSGLDDFEDAVQMAAAAAAGADYIVTRNLKDFSRGPLPAIAPADLLPLL